LDGDLDVALHLRPNPGQVTMAFLERRIAELSSTVRAAEQRGGRTDPYRRVALQDALELQDRIAQGSERLFDCGLYLTAWAEHEPDLDSTTRRVEARLGARLSQRRSSTRRASTHRSLGASGRRSSRCVPAPRSRSIPLRFPMRPRGRSSRASRTSARSSSFWQVTSPPASEPRSRPRSPRHTRK